MGILLPPHRRDDSQIPHCPRVSPLINIQRIGRKLYVTYAMQDGQGQEGIAGPGNGSVNVFDFSGNLLGRLISNGNLNSPWGVALAPENFGDFSHALLVGNFGDGTIHAYDPCSGDHLGTLNDPNGQVISIPGLWALRFGNGHNGGDATTLYFAAGIPGSGVVEDHGLFGSIQPADTAPAPTKLASSAINIQNFAGRANACHRRRGNTADLDKQGRCWTHDHRGRQSFRVADS